MAQSSSSNANLTMEEIQATQNVLSLLFGGGISGGGTSGGGTSGGSSSTTSTSGTPIEIQLLLSAIPIVDDGQVIRSEHHNLIRAALFAIAARLGVTIGGETGPTDKTLTITPVFQHGLYTDWQVGFGLAYVVPGGVTTQGWLSVELPDGALIKSMTLIGRRDSAVTTFSVTLERQEITGGNYEDIITMDLKNSQQLYEVTSNFNGTPGLNEVDNSTYKYLIDAVVTRGESDDSVQIYAIQIVYTTS